MVVIGQTVLSKARIAEKENVLINAQLAVIKTAGLIGVIHSGWQGTVNEITLKVFQHLIRNEGCNPQEFQVYMGKALSQDKFEVDEDVYQKFNDLKYAEQFVLFYSKTGKYHIDNQQTVKRQCELAGIPSGQICVDPTCTFKDPECLSTCNFKDKP